MALNLNGWQRIGVVASVIWAAYIALVAAHDYSSAETFSEELSGICPSLSGRGFVEWRDAKTGDTISIHRQGERSLNCETIANRAATLLAEANSKTIEPAKGIAYLHVASALLIPVGALWVLAYVLVYLFRWVSVGFRPK